MGKVYAVGVGPGSPSYVTEAAGKIIRECDVIIGYRYTLDTIRHLTDGKDVREITMKSQEDAYQKILPELGNKTLVIPFTGDVNFSESEVVDRLAEIFGKVELVPGISAVQVAASRTRIPLDKSQIITMHVTGTIEEKKLELQKALIDGLSVILVPRPWPSRPEKHFMPSEISAYLRERGFATDKMRVHVFEALTTDAETCFVGTVRELEGREFSDLSVMVFDQAASDSYINYRWQWQ
ncbi:MAG: precorrin-6y C5,15-methyltransferase (decarboxylating) subunit CbiE [Nitrosopumilus sp. B06]|nr:MAG: precorrin-6y C5,15-methyltransferase (decarboxylating) subunit CbiE [Nitrosopumilus sp. D6]RNJ80086.1 MAG: precorrin-6y C5,15-methyltransferase (decarboxylating) subunit CbiE [Nitrosopumilus sp. B06]